MIRSINNNHHVENSSGEQISKSEEHDLTPKHSWNRKDKVEIVLFSLIPIVLIGYIIIYCPIGMQLIYTDSFCNIKTFPC